MFHIDTKFNRIDAMGFCFNFQHSSSLEIHLVHFSEKYGSKLIHALANSEGSQDTLAVLSVLVQIQKKDNPKFEPIAKGNDINPIKL